MTSVALENVSELLFIKRGLLVILYWPWWEVSNNFRLPVRWSLLADSLNWRPLWKHCHPLRSVVTFINSQGTLSVGICDGVCHLVESAQTKWALFPRCKENSDHGFSSYQACYGFREHTAGFQHGVPSCCPSCRLWGGSRWFHLVTAEVYTVFAYVHAPEMSVSHALDFQDQFQKMGEAGQVRQVIVYSLANVFSFCLSFP